LGLIKSIEQRRWKEIAVDMGLKLYTLQ